MEQACEVAAVFLAQAPKRVVPSAELEALGRLLMKRWEDARSKWPTVELPIRVFVTHLAQRLPEGSQDSPMAPLLEQLSLGELYLAGACLYGIHSAHECLDRHYLAKLPGMLKGARHSESMIDDVCQLLRVKLLVLTPEGPPRIGEYKGRGSLMNWVRVSAVRLALKLQSTEKPAPEQDADTVLAALPAPGVDAELDLIKRRHHAEFRLAMREAFSVLAADERHLLRLYFADQLSMYELASLFRVNQSTVSRWLKSARQTIYEETRRRLQERLGLSTQDLNSFLAVLDSQLDLSLSQLLGEKDGVPPEPNHG
jgi:RNA polymerase sigma-70 factor (ECF subfamily)